RDHLPSEWRNAVRARQELAESQEGLGLLTADREPDEAEKSYCSALVIWEKLAAESPEVPYYRMRTATVQHRLGMLQLDRGRCREAEEYQQRATTLTESLVQELPALPEYRWSLANSHHGQAEVLVASGKLREAENLFRKAIALR